MMLIILKKTKSLELDNIDNIKFKILNYYLKKKKVFFFYTYKMNM